MPRRRRPRRRRTTTKRRGLVYRKRRARRPMRMRRPRRNILSLPKQIIPRRGFAVHKAVRYIRIPSRITDGTPPVAVNANWNMPAYGFQPTPGTEPPGAQIPFNSLMISCNDPLAPFNEVGTPNAAQPNYPPPTTPAFLNAVDPATGQPETRSQALFDTIPVSGGGVPPTGTTIGYQNQLPSFWQKMKSFYNRWTVIGSKCKVMFTPDHVYTVEYARNPNNSCIFTLGVKPTRRIIDPSAQPQSLTEQPGFITREFHGRTQDYAKQHAFSMTRKWSAKRNMGLSKGNIVNEASISGNYNAGYSTTLHGQELPFQPFPEDPDEPTIDFSRHPDLQQYYCWTGNSLLTNNTTPGAYEPSQWPSGIIKIELEYATVWSDPRFTDNEII